MSETREQTFYSPWPVVGKRFGHQVGEIRSNVSKLKAFVEESYQDLDPTDNSVNAERGLFGLTFGEYNFKNRYRIYYDNSDSNARLLRIDVNVGTESEPVWSQHLAIRDSDGRVIVGNGGISSPAGFYGPVFPKVNQLDEISEIGLGAGTQFLTPNKLFFDTGSDLGFYLRSKKTGVDAGQPVVGIKAAVARTDQTNVWERAQVGDEYVDLTGDQPVPDFEESNFFRGKLNSKSMYIRNPINTPLSGKFLFEIEQFSADIADDDPLFYMVKWDTAYVFPRGGPPRHTPKKGAKDLYTGEVGKGGKIRMSTIQDYPE